MFNLRLKQKKWQFRVQIYALLTLFLLTKAIQPLGFMPGDLSSGTPFVLCHGNSSSVAILATFQAAQPQDAQHSHHEHHHQHHQHDGHHTFHDQGHVEGHGEVQGKCEFSLSGLIDHVQPDALKFVPIFSKRALLATEPGHPFHSARYRLPPLRAPPNTSLVV